MKLNKVHRSCVPVVHGEAEPKLTPEILEAERKELGAQGMVIALVSSPPDCLQYTWPSFSWGR